MDNLPKGTRCSGNFGELGPLLDHYSDKNNVYHLGFEEYVQTMTGGAHCPTPATVHGTDSATKKANASPGQLSPHTARASDARTRHE